MEDTKNDYYIAVHVKAETKDINTHWVGIKGMVTVNGKDYFVVSRTSGNDIPSAGDRAKNGWITDEKGRVLVPVDKADGYVSYRGKSKGDYSSRGTKRTAERPEKRGSESAKDPEKGTTGGPQSIPKETDGKTKEKSSSSGGNGKKIICSELYRQGLMAEDIYEVDERFGEMMMDRHPFIMRGYTCIVRPLVSLMQNSPHFSSVVGRIVRPWSYEMAYRMGARTRGDYIGFIMMVSGVVVCGITGLILSGPHVFTIFLFFILCVFTVMKWKVHSATVRTGMHSASDRSDK